MAKYVEPVDVICDYCEKPAKLVTGATIYPRRKDLHGKKYWHCDPCGAYVGVHENSKRYVPYGRMANAELRRMKMEAHRFFDTLWQIEIFPSRAEAYAWLAERMGMAAEKCHIGMFDIEQCMQTISICDTRLREHHGV